jgi:hypothetical protein
MASLAADASALEPVLLNSVLAECFPELLIDGVSQSDGRLSDSLFALPGGTLQKNAVREIVHARWKEDPTAPEVCLKIFFKAGKHDAFQKEAARMKSLDKHPLIIPLRGTYVRPNGDGVLVLPYYAAGSLQGWFDGLAAKQGSLTAEDWSTARHVLRQTLHGLSFLHARRIAHRDLKPDNLLWSDREAASIVVADFGIARDLSRALETTMALGGAGTLAYAAPEAATPAWKAVPWAADMWAFGVMALQIATGHLWQWNVAQQRLQRMDGSTPVAFSEPPNAGAAARELVMLALSCLSPEPAARPSADDALQAAFFASAETAASDTAGGHAGSSSAPAPALAAKLGALCGALRALRSDRETNDAGWPLLLPAREGEPLCRALLAAVGAAAPADLLRAWMIRVEGEEAPLSSVLRSSWAALPALRLLEQRDAESALDLPYMPRAGADCGSLEALGRLLGKSLIEGVSVDVELAPTLFAYLLGTAHAALSTPGSALAHAAAFDADTASAHRNTLARRIGAGNDMVTVGTYLDNDDETPLSDVNKVQLVCANIRLRLLDSRAKELESLKTGFDAVAAAAGIAPALAALSEWELGAQLSGASGFLDRADLRRRVVWAPYWSASEPQRKWLDDLLCALSGPALRLLMVRAAERVRLRDSGASLSIVRGGAVEPAMPRLLGGGVLQLPPGCPSYEAFCARLLHAIGLDQSAVDRTAVDARSLLQMQRDTIRVLQDAGAVRAGAVYSCKCGAVYTVGACGGAMEVGRCSACHGPIGGAGHFTVAGNRLRTDIDGAEQAAWGHQGYRDVAELDIQR